MSDRVGVIYVELDLDDTRYLRKQKTLLDEAQKASGTLEKNFYNLGIKSGATYDLMRMQAQRSFDAIKRSNQTTVDDMVQAEKAKALRIQQINEQQYGKQISIMNKFKSNYLAISASIAASLYVIQQATRPFVALFEKGFNAVEDYAQSVAGLSAMVVTFSERAKGVSLSEQWQAALKYSTAMVPILENLAAKTLLSGQETTALANAFARAGVFLNASNEKQVESFTRISNALPLMTKGQEIMRQINSEIRAVMTGANAATSMMLQTLRAIDPAIDSNLQKWREQGTVLENIGDLLVGFGPATGLLEKQWQAVKSTIETTATQILRGLMKPAYESIIQSTIELNEWLLKNKENIIKWGISFRIALIDIEAEIRRLAMLLDKMGGTMTTARMFLFGPGSALGVENSVKQFEAAAKANMEYAARYEENDKALQALANKQIALEKELASTAVSAAQQKADASATFTAKAVVDLKAQAQALKDHAKEMKQAAKDAEHLAKALEAIRKQVLAKEASDAWGVQALRDGVMAADEAVRQMEVDFGSMMDGMKEKGTDFQSFMKGISEAMGDTGSLFEGSIFGDGASEEVNNLMKSLGNLETMYEKIAKREEKLIELRIEANKIVDYDDRVKAMKAVTDLETKYTMDSIGAQMEGFTQLFGSIKNMYAENSAEHQRWAMIEKATAIASILLKAAMAIINAGANGDGYTAIARMAAMATAVGSVLSQVGLSMNGPSGGSGSEPADYTAGSTLYGAVEGAVSESLTNSFEMLEDINLEQYGKLIDIHQELQQLNANITGLVTSVVKTGTANSLALPTPTTVDYSWMKLPGEGEGLMGTLISSALAFVGKQLQMVVGWLFGGDVSYETLESGLQHFGTELVHMGDVMSGVSDVMIRPYLWYEQTIDGGFLGEDDKQKKVIYGDPIDDATRFVTKIVQGIGQTMIDLVPILGFGEETIRKIKEYAVALGTIDLKNLSPEQIGEALNAWFSDFADKMAGDIFGDLLKQYQKIDEGLYETAIRLATEKEIILEVLDMTGQAFKGTALEAVHFSQALIELSGDLDSLMETAQTYFDEYLSDAEKMVWLTNNLSDAYSAIGQTMPETREGFKNLISSLDLTNEADAKLYLQLLQLAGATDAYYDALEAANQTIIDAQRELTGTEESGAISDIASRYGLNASWITDDWVGNILDKFINASPEQIEAYAASLGVTTDQLVDDIMFLAETFGYLGDAASTLATTDFAALRDSIVNMLSGISGSLGGGQSASMIMSQITGLQSIPMSEQTGDNLLSMSEKLVQWYNAAVAEAQAVANEESAVANLLIQVADRISSLISQIDSTIRAITYSALNVSLPYQKADTAQGDYNKLLAAAQSGGTGEITEYLGFAQTYLTQQQNNLKSSEAYQDIYASVMADMEAIKSKAEAGGYDAQILAELQSGNTQTEVDLSAIQAEFSNIEGWIINALGTLENLQMIITIDWSNWDGDMADALEMLLALVDVYGWDHTYTLKFLAEVPLDIFSNLSELAQAAGWVADASGGWNSKATIAFVKNVAANWGFENIDQILGSIGWLKTQAGSWEAEVVISYIAELMDRYNVPITQIDYWLAQMGITNSEVARTVKVNLIYEMVSSGSLDLEEVAQYAYNQAYAAMLSDDYSTYYPILKELEMLGSMWDVRSAYNLGAAVNTYGGYNSDPNAWSTMWSNKMEYTAWAEGGVVNSPALGWVAEAGYPEAVIPMKDGLSIPVKWINGGSTGRGDMDERPINITVQVGNEEFDARIMKVSDGVRVKAERRNLGRQRMF